MPSSTIELAQGDPQLIAAVQRSRRLLGHKALLAAAASAVPIPGVDWAADDQVDTIQILGLHGAARIVIQERVHDNVLSQAGDNLIRGHPKKPEARHTGGCCASS